MVEYIYLYILIYLSTTTLGHSGAEAAWMSTMLSQSMAASSWRCLAGLGGLIKQCHVRRGTLGNATQQWECSYIQHFCAKAGVGQDARRSFRSLVDRNARVNFINGILSAGRRSLTSSESASIHDEIIVGQKQRRLRWEEILASVVKVYTVHAHPNYFLPVSNYNSYLF